MSQKLTFEYIKEQIVTRLGGDCRSVELSDSSIRTAISQAMDLWNQYESIVKYYKQASVTTSENNPFYIQLEPDPNFKGIRAVYFLVPYWAVTGGVSIFELLQKMTITMMDISGLALSRSSWQEYRRLRGVDPTWHYDPDTHRLYFYAPSGPFDVGYEIAYAYSDPTQIPIARDSSFLLAVEAYCRAILGEIRGKFGGQVLGPGGGSFTLDAEYQRSKSKEILDEVKQMWSVGRSSLPVPFRR